MLSWGETWESIRPVAFDSSQLRGPELLAIIKALKKWGIELLGAPVGVYTDHLTLEHFHAQKELSRRQARWLVAIRSHRTSTLLSMLTVPYTYHRGDFVALDFVGPLLHYEYC